MSPDKTSQAKIKKPHIFSDEPQKVVVDPALSKKQKIKALDALEQDARQLSVASSEGMTGGEPSKLHDVLDAKDALELPPIAYAYDVVLNDLRSRLKTDMTSDTRTVVKQALAALQAAARPATPSPAARTSGPGGRGGPKPGSAAEIDDEVSREKLDP
jgi:hypothetical protein